MIVRALVSAACIVVIAAGGYYFLTEYSDHRRQVRADFLAACDYMVGHDVQSTWPNERRMLLRLARQCQDFITTGEIPSDHLSLATLRRF